MTSLLRSSKFVRYFAGFARSLVFNPSRGETDGSFVQKSHCLTTSFTKSLATQTVSTPQQESNLDRSLRRLDQDVRRLGRISRRELEDVLEEIRHTRSATSTQSLLIIRCCGNLVPEEPPEVRTQLVQEIWKTLENLGVPMDVSHYNALLRVYLENEHRFSPTEFLANLERKGVEPNRVTYQRLIARYCQDGDIEGATRILEFMREKQLPVNESVFNALIMGHSQADDMESAAGIIQVMNQAGLEPSADTYATLLNGYAKRGNMEAIDDLLKECDSKEIFLLDKDFMDIIYTLTIHGYAEHVDKIMGRMRQTAGYNQDAVNLILRLVNSGNEDIAMKILSTMSRAVKNDGHPLPSGSFLIRQLVRANRPIEKIVAVCLQMERDEMNPQALCLATETSLLLGNIEQSCALLEAMKQEGHPIRHHYFWPLLVACGKKEDRKGLLEIVRTMNLQFNLSVGGETVRDYVVPHLIDPGQLNSTSADVVINQLRSANVSIASASSAVVCNLLTLHKLSDAAQVASRYRAHYSLALFRKPLVQAFQQTRDVQAYISMVHQIYDGADRLADVVSAAAREEESQAPVLDRTEVIGQLVLDVVNSFRKDKAVVVQQVLEGLVNQGLSISNSAAERLQEKLGAELTSEISSLLSKLTSGELVPQILTRSSVPPLNIMDENVLKAQISALEAKGEAARGVKKQLLILYCRSRDLEKAESLIKELEADGFVFSSGVYAQLIELYTHHENLEKAFNILKTLQARDPDFALDDTKTIKLATLLVNQDRFQDAIQLIKSQPRDNKLEDRTFVYNSLCWRLLNSLAEQGRVDDVKEMFKVLTENQFIDVNNVLLGPLIKVHLVKEDLPAAVAQFEECCQKYRATPWKNELACKLIQAEDAAALQHLTDLSTQVHGEINSLYDLVFSFVECGRIRQARKILETPGLRSRPQRINSACERYRQEGKVTTLEGLVEATRDLSHIDRTDLFHHLLLSYCKAKDVDKALGLWTRMQDEDVQPTDQFLIELGKFLQIEGREVPFAIPSVSKPLSTPSKPIESVPTASSSSDSQQLKQALRKEDYQQALEIKQRLVTEGKDNLSVTDNSGLIEGLVKDNRLSEASNLAVDMLRANNYPLPRIFRFLLNRLAVAGEVDALVAIGKLLDPEKKKMVSFDNRLCHANVVAGRGSQYLDSLEEEINGATKENLEIIAGKFPRGGAIGLLEKQPELCAHFERVARKYAEHGILAPINILWIHALVTGQEAAAEKLWEEFLDQSPRVMFQHIAQVAREKNNADLAHKMIDKLRKSKVSERALGVAYSCVLDVLVNSGQPDEGMKVLEAAIKDVCLENFNRTALQRLQSAVTLQGKTFPYKIPEKGTKLSSTSSSSSDDESKPVSAQKV